jgi:hypothetical protein
VPMHLAHRSPFSSSCSAAADGTSVGEKRGRSVPCPRCSWPDSPCSFQACVCSLLVIETCLSLLTDAKWGRRWAA